MLFVYIFYMQICFIYVISKPNNCCFKIFHATLKKNWITPSILIRSAYRGGIYYYIYIYLEYESWCNSNEYNKNNTDRINNIIIIINLSYCLYAL